MLGALRRCPATLPRTISSRACRVSVELPLTSSVRIASLRSSPLRVPVSARLIHETRRWQQQAAAQSEHVETTEGGPITRFADLAERGLVNGKVIQVLLDNGLRDMTDVQTATINEGLKGMDL